MTQILLDRTAETASFMERMRFLRQLEDAQTPVTFVDRQGKKHLVYVSKVSSAFPALATDGQPEARVTVVCVDVQDHRWPQMAMDVSVSVSVATVLA